MKVTTGGVGLAKAVFAVRGVDGRGKVVFRKSLKRIQVLPFFATRAPCLIGREACGSATTGAQAHGAGTTGGPAGHAMSDVMNRG